MGDYLKEAYLLAAINKDIDDDFQKLSDKLENLRLSHNRKRDALKKIYRIIENLSSWTDRDIEIARICSDALFCDGRVNSRPIGKPKKKGGNDAC